MSLPRLLTGDKPGIFVLMVSSELATTVEGWGESVGNGYHYCHSYGMRCRSGYMEGYNVCSAVSDVVSDVVIVCVVLLWLGGHSTWRGS